MITATIVFLVVLALVYAAMIVAELEFIASEREKIYELTFIKVQAILQYEQPTEKRMNELLVLIRQLENWDNSEKVKFLKSEFFRIYKPLSDELLSQNEFEPEMIFSKS
jgi:hypothetical protein